MTRCSYCNSELRKMTGVAFIKNDGSILNFCSSKCEKHWEKKRKLKYISKKVKK